MILKINDEIFLHLLTYSSVLLALSLWVNVFGLSPKERKQETAVAKTNVCTSTVRTRSFLALEIKQEATTSSEKLNVFA